LLEDTVGPNDITSVRELKLETGNTLYVKRTDPYGFFRFSLERGAVPDWMKGNYTSLQEVQKAIQQYERIRQLEKTTITDLISDKTDKKKKT